MRKSSPPVLPGLFDAPPPPVILPPMVIARSSDPETSHQAAEALNDDPVRMTRSILAVVELLEQYGSLSDFGLRDHFSEKFVGKFSYTLPCKARHWAREQGLVKWTGLKQHHSKSSTPANVWTLGRDEEWLRKRAPCPTCGKPGYNGGTDGSGTNNRSVQRQRRPRRVPKLPSGDQLGGDRQER